MRSVILFSAFILTSIISYPQSCSLIGHSKATVIKSVNGNHGYFTAKYEYEEADPDYFHGTIMYFTGIMGGYNFLEAYYFNNDGVCYDVRDVFPSDAYSYLTRWLATFSVWKGGDIWESSPGCYFKLYYTEDDKNTILRATLNPYD